jgi:hypothetical protein
MRMSRKRPLGVETKQEVQTLRFSRMKAPKINLVRQSVFPGADRLFFARLTAALRLIITDSLGRSNYYDN